MYLALMVLSTFGESQKMLYQQSNMEVTQWSGAVWAMQVWENLQLLKGL
jgi:hypothetical protein